MSEAYKPYRGYAIPDSLKDYRSLGAAAKIYNGYDAINVAAAKQQASAQAGQSAGQAQTIQTQASSLLELWQVSYAMSGLLIRDVTAKKAREIAAHELAQRLANALEDKIEAGMKAQPAFNTDAVRYEVQFHIHTREEFKQAVRAEAKKLLETALS